MRAPAGSLCKAVARYFCARPPGRFVKQECAFFAHARQAAFVKQGRAIFARARQAVFVKQGRTIFARARRVVLQSRGALFLRAPAGSFCKAEARYFCTRPPGRFAKQRRVFCARRAASLPRLSAVRARPSTARSGPHSLPSVHPRARPLSPGHGSVSSAPACPLHARPLSSSSCPVRTRPLSSSSCPVRTRPLSLPFSPFPPPGPAIIRSSIPGARPLSHSVRPAAAPVSPCAAALFPSPFTIPRASFAKKRCPRRRSDTAGVRPRLPCLRRSILRPDARAGGAGGGATVAAAIKPACRAGGARVSGGMIGEIVRPARCAGGRRGCGPGFRACVARFCGPTRAGGAGGGATVAAGHKTGLPRGRGAGIRRNGRQNRQAGPTRAVGGGGRGRCPVQPFFCKKEETRHRGFARAALHESGRGCEYYRRGE